METLFFILTTLDVFSLRLPIAGRELNASYAAIGLIICAGLVGLGKHRGSTTRKDAQALYLPLLILLGAIAIPLLLSDVRHTESIYYTVMLTVWVTGMVLASRSIRISIIKFFRVYLTSIIAVLAISIPTYFIYGEQRLDSIFGGATNRLGIYSTIALLCMTYIIAHKLDPSRRRLYYLGSILCLAGFVLTFSRTAFLAFFIAFAEHSIRNKVVKFRYLVLAAVSVATIVFFLNYQYVSTGEWKYLKLMIKLGVNDLFGYEHIEMFRQVSRVDHYANAYQLLTQDLRTFFFGLGMESYRNEEFLANTRGHATALHSMYLQYLMGGGILAISALMLYIGILLNRIYNLPLWQKDLCLFLVIPALIHAAFQPAIFSREILIFAPILVLSCMHGNRLASAQLGQQIAARNDREPKANDQASNQS